MSVKKRFNTGWFFHKTTMGHQAEDMDNASVNWEPVDIPHDWLIGQVRDLYETSEGWYKNTLRFQNPPSELISIRFDGVYMDTTLYINNKEIGSWKYGYSSFEFVLNPHLRPGTNIIKLRVRHQAPNSRWYSGAGIYRNVWLRYSAPEHFLPDGIYISAGKKEGGIWQVSVQCEVSCTKEYTLLHQLLDKENRVLCSCSQDQFFVTDPVLWDTSEPYLYHLRSRLLVDGNIADEEMNTFGFRTLEFTGDRGFFLNGKPLKLKGVCNHHDLGALGAAFYREAARRQLFIIREMGANALRTAHNMPAPELLELADEMGILVVNEAFDMWERSKTKYDYARFFKEYSAKDMESWIKRDRNHPCIILWSIGNEIYDTHADEHGQDITRRLMEKVEQYDPMHNAAVTIGSNYMPWENAQKCADIVKIAGYNYGEKYYRKHHEEHPDWSIYGSETGSIVQSRGIYHFPLNRAILSDDDCQCSSLGNSTTSWGAKDLEFCVLKERDTPYSLGQFIWSGFDYIGEPTPYHTKNSYFGQIDTAGFPKDSYYFFQSAWTYYKDKPTVHLLPYWDFNEGQRINVRAFSNAPCVELFLNGASHGKQSLEHEKGNKIIGDWEVPYHKGELKVIAYDESMQIIAADIRRSFGDAHSLRIQADKPELAADGEDLIFLTITASDENNFPVENANNRITVTVTGAGRLLGLDNGDSTDYDEYQCASRRLFGGKLLAIVSSDLKAGPIQVTAASPGLKAAALELRSIKPSQEPVVSANFSCRPDQDTNVEIPVRKIELISPMGQSFSRELTTLSVKAKIYPKNATYNDLNWRITGPAGVEVKNASISPDAGKADIVRITALGDGDFVLRCTCNNGKDCVSTISSLEYHITGLGFLYTNPYEFVSASLYRSFTGELSPGNERGVATARDSKTTVTFDHIDFGDYGSDIITLPIFELNSEPAVLTFREGNDSTDDSSILGIFTYYKPSIWNVYQEETFRLNRRLRGITSLTIELEHKVHIKGFVFKAIDKAYETLYATEADAVYGDSFRLEQGAVTGIGNNVSLLYRGMDFGDTGFTKLLILGRCPIDKNTIHVRFHNHQGEDINQIAEFTHTDGYMIQEFTLTSVKDLQDVTFVFLPGSNFDFRWFRFEK